MPRLEAVDQPAAEEGAFAPWLAPAADGLLLTWLEPVTLPAADGSSATGHRLRFARYTGRRWSRPVTVAEGSGFFANWADVPSIVEAEDGTLLTHWLEKTGDATYAYGIRLARSVDHGASWQGHGLLHDDATATEHGFVSWVALGGDRLRAFWLDGRETAQGGPMTLRTAIVGARVEAAETLDDQVCDCCPTAAVRTPDGPLVAYRDRSPDEVRDVFLRHRRDGAWAEPVALHHDGWVFPACPVNGPALAAGGGQVAAAWFTGEGDAPRVLAAFSEDGGRSFGEPVEIDRGEQVMGRVGIALAPEGTRGGGAVVSWLVAGEQGGVTLRRVGTGGTLGEPWTLAETASSRASGIARVVARGDLLYATWTWKGDDDQPSRLGFAAIPWDRLPAGRGR